MPTPLSNLVDYTDRLLRHRDIADFPGALNGLQLENNGSVKKIAAAVDANILTVEKALVAGADLLLVHHGIGWSPLCPVTGNRRRWLASALAGNLAIYSSHLPLDAHPRLGNNILLARSLGLLRTRPFFEEKGTLIGRQGSWSGTRTGLAARLGGILGVRPVVLPGGPERVRRIGIVTGGAGNELVKVAAAGIDTFITGEGAHWTFGVAHELGLNVIYGGHYLTETAGVKALASHLSKRFHLPWLFIDVPSGL
ncbi:MAG: Nif3-like dinuclear metal center hexameric protein [Candidatus Methylacidiphilales bacterium]|nr:Nif3-like dinuclear metal center hexameric protein [Candidatus Methylacidiphilales bacterium]